MDRRTLLRGASLLAALPLVGCTDEPPPAADPDDLLRAQAAERERSLLAEYDAALLALPVLSPRLLAVRADHAEHLAALTGPPPSSAPSSAPSPTPTALPPAEVPPAPTAEAALAGLVAAETAAAGGHREGALAARDGDLAGLLASLSASESSHPVALA